MKNAKYIITPDSHVITYEDGYLVGDVFTGDSIRFVAGNQTGLVTVELDIIDISDTKITSGMNGSFEVDAFVQNHRTYTAQSIGSCLVGAVVAGWPLECVPLDNDETVRELADRIPRKGQMRAVRRNALNMPYLESICAENDLALVHLETYDS